MDDNTFDGIYFVPVASTLDSNLGKPLKDIEPYIQGALNIGSQVFANNNTNKLGSAVNLLGSTMGGWKGTALQVAGNVINGLVGSNINKQNKAAAEAELSRMRNYTPMANSNASLTSQINNFTVPYYTSKFFGTQGLLNHDADNLAEHFNDLMHLQIPRIQDLFNNNAYRLAVNAADNQRNFNLSALGGLLYADGGPTWPVPMADWTNGIDYIGAGGSHESNPNLGVPVSIALDGLPNLVEEGEAIFNDYVFSKRIKVPKSFKRKYALGGSIKTFADAALKLGEESKERPNDPISKRGLLASMGDLAMLQELIRLALREKEFQGLVQQYAEGGHLFKGTDPNEKTLLMTTELDDTGEKDKKLSPQELAIKKAYDELVAQTKEDRNLGRLGLGLLAGKTIYDNFIQKPNYAPGNMLLNAASRINYMPISTTPRGELLRHQDPYNLNQLRALQAGTNAGLLRAYLNASSPLSAGAGLTAIRNILAQQDAQAVAAAQLANEQAANSVRQYNSNLVNQWATHALEADKANQAAYKDALDLYAGMIALAANINNKAYEFNRDAVDTTTSTLLSQLLQGKRDALNTRLGTILGIGNGNVYVTPKGSATIASGIEG